MPGVWTEDVDISSDVYMEEWEVWMYASLRNHATATVRAPIELQGVCPQTGQGISEMWVANAMRAEWVAQDLWCPGLNNMSVRDYL